jgi:hypothetical protein
MKTKINKATKVNVSAILADIKKSGDAPVSQANIKRLRHILPPEALVRGTRLKISDIQPHSFNMEISPTNRKTKSDKISKVKLNTIVAKIKKRGVAPLSAESVAKMENVPPFAWPTKGAKTLPAHLKKFVVEAKKAQSKKPFKYKVMGIDFAKEGTKDFSPGQENQPKQVLGKASNKAAKNPVSFKFKEVPVVSGNTIHIARVGKDGKLEKVTSFNLGQENPSNLVIGKALNKASKGEIVDVLRDPRLNDTEYRTPKTHTKAKTKKGSRLAAVYANILKGVPTWKVQGHPAPQYTTGNMPGHTVLASSTVKVVKRGHSKPKALEAPYGKKPSKLFTPPAKDVELGKQVKALRAGTKNKTQKG